MNETLEALLGNDIERASEASSVAEEGGTICPGCQSVVLPPGQPLCPHCSSEPREEDNIKLASDDELEKLASAVRYIANHLGEIVDDRSETEKFITTAAQYQDLLKAASALDNPPNIEGSKGGKQLWEEDITIPPDAPPMSLEALIRMTAKDADTYNMRGIRELLPLATRDVPIDKGPHQAGLKFDRDRVKVAKALSQLPTEKLLELAMRKRRR